MATIEGYMRSTGTAIYHKFFKETQDIPNFGMDVLNEVTERLSTLSASNNGIIHFTDPITGLELALGY